MRRWPTMVALARAKRSDLIRAWAGLGYNRRAVYLHRLAQEVTLSPAAQELFALSCESAKGISRRVQELQRLPGIGPYTATALLAFAWNLPAPCVDTNVRRVLAYAIYRRPSMMQMSMRQIMALAVRVIPHGRGRDWNYALMDYGALVLTARTISKWPRPGGGHRRSVAKFEGSSRFWRGRIVAVLRDEPRGVSVTALRRKLLQFGEPPKSHAPLLSALMRDGVIARSGGRYALA